MLPVLGICLTTAMPVQASEFAEIREKSDFLALVDGRELRIGLFSLHIAVLPDGRIEGSALGWELTGSWSWQDGYFCRKLDWSGSAIPYNCQLVEARGTDEIRFTVDKGTGDSASFSLR